MGVPAADDPEASSDDDEELEALLRRDALKAVAANDTSGKFQVAAEDEGTIATGNTVYAIATKKGGLARDHLAEVVSKITKNGQVFLTYMDKTEEQEEVKSVARIMASAVTASCSFRPSRISGCLLNEEEVKKAGIWHDEAQRSLACALRRRASSSPTSGTSSIWLQSCAMAYCTVRAD